MPHLVPPHLQDAFEQVNQAFKAVQGTEIDLQKTSWAEIEKGIVKLLGGAFDMRRPEHQAIALGLCFVLGERLAESEKGFWFPNRDLPEGVMIGFPEALITITPFATVLDALRRANLPLLDQVQGDIRRSIASVKFAPQPGAGAVRLNEADYARLFDPGFLQFVVLDGDKVKSTLESKPDRLANEVREGVSRAQELPAEAKQQFDQQVTGSLRRLDAAKSLAEHVAVQPRLGELALHLFATTGSTGAAPAEFWDEVVLPLLFIGEPEKFPPIDKEDLEALGQGADPLALFLDLVPYQTQAPEDGLLGAFTVDELAMVHPSFNAVPSPRMIGIKQDRIAALLQKFDPAREKQLLQRFDEHLAQLAGKPIQRAPGGEEMREAALTLLTDLKRVLGTAPAGKGVLCMRRLTESEAMSEPALNAVRKSIGGPRIILA